ncbi:hypothetical protein D9K89_22130 [Klebsiella pneumoniae]|nr:hypothetical protein D9K89_22130 [Klebsiella pneumoniae]
MGQLPGGAALAGPTGEARRKERRPDKAFMPPSGTITGTAPDRPAALRLPVLGGEPAGRNVGRIRH